MEDIKDIILERRINNLEIEGKQVPDKYISVFNSYLEQIAESLADYTKQVRKEAIGELMNMLGDRAELIDFGNGNAEFMFTTYDLQECSKDILDQYKESKYGI